MNVSNPIKVLLGLLLCFGIGLTQASSNLSSKDYIGEWIAVPEITPGEETRMIVRSDGTVSFSRMLKSGNNQEFEIDSSQATHSNGIYIYQFGSELEQSMYRLVLSGWATAGTKRVFGMLYLYRQGVLFNGLPVLFEPAS